MFAVVYCQVNIVKLTCAVVLTITNKRTKANTKHIFLIKKSNYNIQDHLNTITKTININDILQYVTINTKMVPNAQVNFEQMLV